MQPDLFAPSPAPGLVPGLRVAAELVDREQERALVAFVDRCELEPFKFQGWLGKRLTTSFGWSYDFERGRIERGAAMPEELLPLRTRMAAFAGVDPDDFVQALLIRYDPGAGIGWHRDRPQFGVVVGLSLGAPATLRLRRRRSDGKFERQAVPLTPRGAYVLDAEVRHEWEHSIAAIDATRWSITFRTLSDLGKRALG